MGGVHPHRRNLQAARPADLGTFGKGRARYGALVAPPEGDLAELRRQQAAFDQTTDAISRDNQWMAVPALAPAAAVLGLEGAAIVTRGLATGPTSSGPLALTQRWPYQRGGETPSTQAGRQAHDAFTAKVEAKPGWEANRVAKGTRLRPDAAGPARNPADDTKRMQLELKPDTVTGRRRGAEAVEKYQSGTGNKTRVVYYDPKDFM